jgi:soluble P-type ATPase
VLHISIPGVGPLELEHLVLDVNGTVALDGTVLSGVAEGIAAVRDRLRVVAITADTHGTAPRLREQLAIDVHVIPAGGEGAHKLAFVESLGCATVIAAGNGANDAEMLRAAAIGVCVVGDEGAAAAAVAAADVVVSGVGTLFGLLENPTRLVATLRR